MPPKARATAVQTTLDGTAVPKPASKAKAKAKPKPSEGEDGDAAAVGGGGLSEHKLALPQWLKLFTERGVNMRLAMTLAGKL